MPAITSLSESDQIEFLTQVASAEALISACLTVCMPNAIKAYLFFSETPEIGMRYIKFHHYALVSSTIDTVAVLIAGESGIDLDAEFRHLTENLKARYAFNTFNSVFSEFPFSTMHGQDILLFRALENASLNGGISFFDYQKLRLHLADAVLTDIKSAHENDLTLVNSSRTPHIFGGLLSDPFRLRDVDLSFNRLNAQYAGSEQAEFVKRFEKFMNNLPPNVFHCHDGKSIYSNKGFTLRCSCGVTHPIDECQAICDGGYAHFVVLRSPCETTISQVASEGIFRIKGIKIISSITANKILLDCVEQAVSARKRTR